MENKSVALDGPAGAGKSTLARMTAKRFGMIYVDTGALYRCIGLFALREGVATKDEAAVTGLLPRIRLEMCYDENGVQRMLLNGEDVTEAIRAPAASAAASDVSALPSVRAFLLSMQREMAQRYDVIMDGRDIGTVVLPNAGLKVFLTAKPEVRAKRRHMELQEKEFCTTYEEVLCDINHRDKNDSCRAAAPLRAAEDAVRLDTSGLDLMESYEALGRLVSEKLGKKEA